MTLKNDTMYQLKISKEQLEVIAKALDLFSRVGSGQFEEIFRHPTIQKRQIKGEINHQYIDEARRHLDVAKRIAMNLESGVSIGITVADEPNRVAYDIYQVIMHELAKRENPNGKTVHHHGPMQWSEQKLPEISMEEK